MADVNRSYEVVVTADNRSAVDKFRELDREWSQAAGRFRDSASKMYADFREQTRTTFNSAREEARRMYAEFRERAIEAAGQMRSAMSRAFASIREDARNLGRDIAQSLKSGEYHQVAKDINEILAATHSAYVAQKLLRAGLSGSALPLAGTGVAILAKQLYDVTDAQRTVARTAAEMAAATGRSYEQQATINYLSDLLGGANVDPGAGRTVEQLAAIGRELSAIEDPVARSARAVALLGSDAARLKDIIGDRVFGRAVDSAHELATSLDSETRIALDRFGESWRTLKSEISSVGDEIEALGERVQRRIAVEMVRALDLAGRAARTFGAAESGAFLGDPSLDPRTAYQGRVQPRPSDAEFRAGAQSAVSDNLARLSIGRPNLGVVGVSAGGVVTQRAASEETAIRALGEQQARTRQLVDAFNAGRSDLASALVDADRAEKALRLQVEAFKRGREATEEAKRLSEGIARQRLTAEAGLVTGALKATYGDSPLAQATQRARDAATFTAPDGTQQNIGLTLRARLANEAQLRADTLALAKKTIDEEEKLQRAAFERRLANETSLYQKRLANIVSLDEEEQARDRRIRGFDESAVGRSRDRQLRAIGRIRPTTASAIASLEGARAAVEVDAERQLSEIRKREFDLDTERERQRIARLGATADRLRTFEEQRALERIELERATQARIDEIRENASDAAFRRQEQQYRDFFERIRSSTESSMDALFSRGAGGVGEFFKRAATATFIAPAKQILSSQFAATATRLLTGQQVSFAGDDNGPLGRLGGLLQRLGLGSPVFGNNRVVTSQDRNTAALEKLTATIAGGGAGVAFAGASPLGIAGLLGPGGTSGFAGPVGRRGTGGVFGSIFGGGFQFSNARDFVGLGSSISTGAGSATTLSAATTGQIAGSVARSDAAALAGVGLAIDGIRRGGPVGVAEAGGGGALVGFKFGGATGALIGATVGATAALVRTLFFKGQTNVRDRIKQAYGVDVTDDGMTSHLTAVIKQQFGGSIDAALASPQVRDLVELYAIGTNQKGSNFAQKANAIILANSNGQLYQASATYGGRQAAPFTGAIPGLGGGAVTLKLDADATARVLQGQAATVIAGRPELVTTAAARGAETSGGRQGMTAATLDPFSLIV